MTLGPESSTILAEAREALSTVAFSKSTSDPMFRAQAMAVLALHDLLLPTDIAPTETMQQLQEIFTEQVSPEIQEMALACWGLMASCVSVPNQLVDDVAPELRG